MLVSCFCTLYGDIDSESNHILGEREEDCKYIFLTRLSVLYIYVCVRIMYICIHTHTNILKLLKKCSRCMFLPKLLVYYVFLYFASTIGKRLIHKLCSPFRRSGRMFGEEMW